MTTTTTERDLPTLNAVGLYEIVMWAEDSEEGGRRLREIQATWNQGTWGQIVGDLRLDGPNGLSLEQIESPEEQAALAQRLRNGECQTAFCIAGAAAIEADYRLVLDPLRTHGRFAPAEHCVQQAPTGRVDERGHMLYADVPGAPSRRISEAGREYLGLSEAEADVMFDGDNDLHKIKAVANWACDSRGLPLLFPGTWIYDPNFEDEDEDE